MACKFLVVLSCNVCPSILLNAITVFRDSAAPSVESDRIGAPVFFSKCEDCSCSLNCSNFDGQRQSGSKSLNAPEMFSVARVVCPAMEQG
ncbi:hypothetical protein B0H14DRAFT_2712413 [Mycena olivaceomarginata]|nr:hypothetical protein B0H14DRAFT_3011685 [Mycena olivaceomarginata]KAJ7868210.1 hypothetical protein B0H14DRAFT_2730098 [Mycena olivaceomarginata]KAJ7877691.1 hypothetical protein B0H14DRAFT_2712413 [Mycena olivaceomarginata]